MKTRYGVMAWHDPLNKHAVKASFVTYLLHYLYIDASCLSKFFYLFQRNYFIIHNIKKTTDSDLFYLHIIFVKIILKKH